MNLGIVLIVILLLLLFGAFPVWPHAATWGYGPSGLLLLVLLVVIVLVVAKKL